MKETRNMKSFISTLAIAALLVALAPMNAGATSTTVTYQGSVTDTFGAPATGLFDVRLSLYTIATGGTQLWQETHASIETIDGRFAIEMGNATPFGTLFDDEAALWLEVEVDLDGGGFDASELYSPRVPVTASPYALSGSGATFTAGNAIAAMGAKSDGNALNHDKFTQADVSANTNVASNTAASHTKYTNAEAVSAVGLTAHAVNASAHHTRYANAEAVSAMGTKGDANALNHDQLAVSGAGSATTASRSDHTHSSLLNLPASETLRIIRGSGNGFTVTIFGGTGWSFVRPSTGFYQITFSTPFSAPPTVVSSAQGSFNTASPESITTTGFNIRLTRTGSIFTNSQFYFIAIGN